MFAYVTGVYLDESRTLACARASMHVCMPYDVDVAVLAHQASGLR